MKTLNAILIGLTVFSLVNLGHADRYAVLVGVDEYESTYDPGRLFSCVNDALGMRHCFMDDPSRWSAENIDLLSNETATKSAIRNKLAALATTAVSGDLVVYFHSGHGGQHSGTDTFICSYDANYEDYEFAEDLALFSDGVKIIVMIDTCFSGGMIQDVSAALSNPDDSTALAPRNLSWNFAQNVMDQYSANPKMLTSNSLSTKSPTVGWITACDYDELSLSGASYSLFTEKIIYGFLHGDHSANGAVSFRELYDYAAPRALFQNPTQTAQLINGSLLTATEALATMTGDPAVQEALDQTALLVHSKPGPAALWSAQAGTTHDGIDAVRSGSVPDGQAAEFGIRVAEPGTLTFWWKTSSEANYDGLILLANNTAIAGLSGETDWEKQTLEIGPGEHLLRWIYAKDDTASEGSDCGWVDQIVWTPNAGANNPSLFEAIDTPVLPTTTGGNQLWFSQSGTTHDGIDAAQSGSCTNNQTTWFNTELVGPGTFSFWWKVSSEADFDFLKFSINNELKSRLSGETGWLQETYTLGVGLHTASWCYAKDTTAFSGDDCGWVDQVVWTGATDADGDGHNTLQEHIAGTDPTDIDSCFTITNYASMTDHLVIEWPAVSGRVYNVFCSTNLLTGFQPLNTEEIDYPVNSYTDTVLHVEGKCFYKMDVRLK